ncbi:hypothetical protein [Bradyrhizobium sp. AUGA SZCCT0283]|jgi:hypothetical protein|uniref:hypothetical protein n=1 Tax=Bradyrhizobium sp. AUGA SZCCT0283 TaxID=2807671 RepID=UPI001BADA2D4|nr:hypothetical protein [Bradyrhizobium sp. AUGA SZCCT0283]
MALPDMVVDKPVLDRSQDGAWSRGHVCVRVASDILGAVEECVLAALTGSVLLKILSVGYLTPSTHIQPQHADCLRTPKSTVRRIAMR